MLTFQRTASALLCAFALGLGACGGGSGTAVDKPPQAVQLTGHFIDAPVAGLCYSSNPSGLNGVTNAGGDYRYVAGDRVTFSVPTQPGNCASGGLTLASAAPLATGSADVQTLVLDLPNGLRVAEVLNALNHGSATAMDVSGLTMPASVASNLSTYIATGASPAGVSISDMLAGAQSATTAPSSYVVPVTDSFIASVDASLAQTVGTSPSGSTINLSDLPGALWFRTSSDGHGAFDLIDSVSQMTDLDPMAAGGVSLTTQALTISGNTFTVAAGTADASVVTVSYRDSQKMLYSVAAPGSVVTSATGVITALQPIAPADAAGRTLTFKNLDTCNNSPMDLVVKVSADGTSWQSQTFSSVVFTASADPALAGLIKLTASNGALMYVGLAKGSTLAPGGSIAVVYMGTYGGAGGGSKMAQVVANPATAPVCSDSVSAPTNFYSSDGPMTLGSTEVYLRYVGTAPITRSPGPLTVLPQGYQLCLFSDTAGQNRTCGQVSDGINAGTNGSGNFANQMVLDVTSLPMLGSKVYFGWFDTATGAFFENGYFSLDANGLPPNGRQFDVHLQ